jgi:DNA mismatch repair protein MutL
MGTITRLSDELASKIAAGEVIERPASIVKELMENSIDAGAGSITVELKNGGIDFIRVQDDGDGILSEDVELAVQRHTTSKLHDEQGLYEIATLGFRGEALYSIGVISEVELVTKHKTEDMGTRLSIKGGEVLSKADVAHDRGTSVSISNLFFNTPARKKFLGSPQAEYRACLDVIDRFVFGCNNVGIRLINNSKEVFNIQPAAPETRAVLRIDPGLKNKLYSLSSDNGIIKVDGFISDPDYTTNSSRLMYLFVNGRYVIDRSINYTVTNAYSTALPGARYPVAVLNIYLPHHFVDVNVNPTKTVVKFADKAMVYEAVSKAVRNTINKRSVIYTTPDLELAKNGYSREIKEAASSYITRHQQGNAPETGYNTGQNTGRNAPAAFKLRDTQAGSETAPQKNLQEPFVSKGEFSSLNIYAQFHATYIIASTPDNVVLIDQHAMHERIIFEQLLMNSRTRQRHSQFLTAPQEIFLNESRMSALLEMQDILRTIGYELTIKNDRVLVNAIPAGTAFSPLSLIEFIDNKANADDSTHTELTADQKTDPLYMIMADIACKSAVRAGDFLPVEKIKALLLQLDRLGIPLNCPHGRPFVFVLPKTEIEKFFHRR